MVADLLVHVQGESAIVEARQAGRRMALALGMSSTDAIQIATAISEVARNILTYAETGQISLRTIRQGSRSGVEVVAEDRGPGIEDVHKAMRDGFSTGNGLGLGLPGAQRLMDEFQIRSEPGGGTRIRMVKWAA